MLKNLNSKRKFYYKKLEKGLNCFYKLQKQSQKDSLFIPKTIPHFTLEGI